MTAENSTRNPAEKVLHFARSYVFLVGLPIVAIVWILSGMPSSPISGSASGAADATRATPGAAMPNLLLLLAQVVVILVASRAVGRLLRRLGQPQVIGEMAAGILLGPSFLGLLAPEFSAALFPATSLGFLSALSQIGIVLYMFVVGLELDPAVLRGRTEAALLTSHTSISAPFLLAVVLAIVLYPEFSGPGMSFPQFAMFIGAAMSVTAFPVLARILAERDLLNSRVGALAITGAAVGDLTAWCILAYVSAMVRTSSVNHPLWLTIGGTVLFSVLVLTVGRRIFTGLATRFERQGYASADLLAVVIVAGLAGAVVTEWLGVHALFGAFLVGAAMPKQGGFANVIRDRFADVLTVLLLPLFFAFTGLRTRLGLIHGAEMWLICGAIIAVAIAGKLGGSALASRLSGLGWRESAAVGILMNTRGLIELVFLNVGLELGVISPPLFAMMVLMALVTTLMTTPLLAWVWPAGAKSSPQRNHPGRSVPRAS